MPLAPGQKKQIVIFDWERKEQASRTEGLTQTEALSNELSRDRDINEIANSVLKESMTGSSRADSYSDTEGGGGLEHADRGQVIAGKHGAETRNGGKQAVRVWTLAGSTLFDLQFSVGIFAE